ncbi:MAG: MFS transporter [Actinobacteria bacterium]|nr:MFS transporter [Actinomycetota bacterium]
MPPLALAPLRHRPYATVFSAALVSNIGSWMQTVALGVVVTQATHNPLWTGLVAAAGFVPSGLLAPIGGALADRHNRKHWLLVTTLAEALVALALTLLYASGAATPLLAVLLSFAGGVAGAMGFPAYQALLPDLVPEEDLLSAVSLSSAQYNLGRVIGPALAGLLLVAAGPAWCFGVNAISFFAVVAALLSVSIPTPLRSAARGLIAELGEGIAVMRCEVAVKTAFGSIAVLGLLVAPFIALIPAMAIEGLGHHGHAGDVATSTLVTAQGIGAVIGALSVAGLAKRFGRARMIRRAALVASASLIAYGAANTTWAAALALALVGASYMAMLSGLMTVVQLRAPNALRARVVGLFMFALGTCYPIGALIQGALGAHFGVRRVTAIAAAIALLVVAIATSLWPKIVASLADPNVEAPAGG